MAEVKGAIPRIRPGHGPAVLGYGFRPFFFAAALWGVLSMLLWLPAAAGLPVLATAFEPLAWHAHEMLFGFVGAAVCGFLLTAIPNWTGRLPLQGAPLAGLVLLWLAGRIAVALSAEIGPGLAAAIDLSVWVALLGVVLREILTGKNWRNLPMAGALALFIVANALMHADVLGWAETGAAGWRLGMAVIIMLIVLIGGRIVPSFTRNWLAKRGPGPLPAPFGLVDRLTMAGSLIAVLAWAAVPDAVNTGILLALAAVLNAVRLGRWQGQRTAAEPLVLVLHLGYVWIPIGLALLAASILTHGGADLGRRPRLRRRRLCHHDAGDHDPRHPRPHRPHPACRDGHHGDLCPGDPGGAAPPRRHPGSGDVHAAAAFLRWRLDRRLRPLPRHLRADAAEPAPRRQAGLSPRRAQPPRGGAIQSAFAAAGADR